MSISEAPYGRVNGMVLTPELHYKVTVFMLGLFNFFTDSYKFCCNYLNRIHVKSGLVCLVLLRACTRPTHRSHVILARARSCQSCQDIGVIRTITHVRMIRIRRKKCFGGV